MSKFDKALDKGPLVYVRITHHDEASQVYSTPLFLHLYEWSMFISLTVIVVSSSVGRVAVKNSSFPYAYICRYLQVEAQVN